MTTGLAFGKFMPVHKGHLALIEFARLIVSTTVTPDDPIISAFNDELSHARKMPHVERNERTCSFKSD